MMTVASMSTSIPAASLRVWLPGSLFVLFQFFLQLSSGVVIGVLMHDMVMSALTAGLLSSSFYIVYTLLQIPVGIMFDCKNPRPLLTINAFLCSIGCIVFASSYSLTGLFFGRTLIGIGSSFAFVGLTHLIRQHYPARQFAFLIGLSETLGFLTTVLGIIGMGSLIIIFGWRDFINTAGLIGIMIASLCWKYIPAEPNMTKSLQHYGKQLSHILTNKKLWVNGLFIGLSFALVTVFGALWAAPFIQIKLACSLRQASLINAMFFLGTGLSCPLFGILGSYFKRRKPLILTGCLLTITLMLSVLFLPISGLVNMAVIMFMLGLCCGSYILAYAIANELAPANSLSTCTGFINTLALITTPLLQPLIGYLLDLFSQDGLYTLTDYQRALLVIPCSLIVAAILVCFLPEKQRS